MSEEEPRGRKPHDSSSPKKSKASKRPRSRFDAGWAFSGLIAVLFILALVIGALVLLVPPLLSPPPTPGPVYQLFNFGEVSTLLDPGRDQLLELRNRQAALYVPVGAYPSVGTLVMQPRDLEFVPIQSDARNERLMAIDLLILDPNGEIVDRPAFDSDLLLCFRLTEELQAMRSERTESVTVQQFDEQELVWQDIPTGPGWEHDQICATIEHLSIFALTVVQPAESDEPEAELKVAPTSTPEPLELYGLPQEIP